MVVSTDTNLHHMIRVFIPKDLATCDSKIVLLSSNQSSRIQTTSREGREVIDWDENVQTGTRRLPQEGDLAEVQPGQLPAQ